MSPVSKGDDWWRHGMGYGRRTFFTGDRGTDLVYKHTGEEESVPLTKVGPGTGFDVVGVVE